MNKYLKWTLIAFGLAALPFVALLAYGLYIVWEHPDPVVLAERTANDIHIQIAIEVPFWDEGGPFLMLRATDERSKEELERQYLGGEWDRSDNAIQIREYPELGLLTFILNGYEAQPFVIWEPESRRFAPHLDSLAPMEYRANQTWKDDALSRLQVELGTDVCLATYMAFGDTTYCRRADE